MGPGFGSEGPGLIPVATKDPSSACGVRASKLSGCESPIGNPVALSFTMGDVSLE